MGNRRATRIRTRGWRGDRRLGAATQRRLGAGNRRSEWSGPIDRTVISTRDRRAESSPRCSREASPREQAVSRRAPRRGRLSVGRPRASSRATAIACKERPTRDGRTVLLVPQGESARPRVFAALVIVASCGRHRCCCPPMGVQSWAPVPEERVLLFVLPGRRFGGQWRFVCRVGLDRRAGRG
jgi:hypothetical protein